MKEKILKIAKEVFNNEVLESSKIGDFENWDSLGQLNLFMALEEELNLQFSQDEIINSNSIKEVIKVVESKND